MTAPGVGREVTDMTGAAALPRRNGELAFDAPWQGRAFGVALATVRTLGLPWAAFQERLMAAIAAHPDAPYWDSWVAALEGLVVERGLASREEIATAADAVRP